MHYVGQPYPFTDADMQRYGTNTGTKIKRQAVELLSDLDKIG
jgi:hypothetical protein